MRTNDCRDCRALISRFIEGELPPEEAARLVRHLESCPGCRQEMEELSRTVELLRRLPQEPAPPEILRGVREAIRHPSLRARWENWTFAWWPRAVAQAIAVVLVGLTVVLIQQRYPVLREETARPPRLEPAAETAQTAPAPGPSSPEAGGAATSEGGAAVPPEKSKRETAIIGMTDEDASSRSDSAAAGVERKASSPEVRPLSMPMMQYQQQAAPKAPARADAPSPPPVRETVAPAAKTASAAPTARPAATREEYASADRGAKPAQKERERPERALKKTSSGQVAGLEQEVAANRAEPEAPAGLLIYLRAPAGYDWMGGLVGLVLSTGGRGAHALEPVEPEDGRRLNELAGGVGAVSSLIFTLPAGNRDDFLRALREKTPLAILDRRETRPERIGEDIRITLFVWQAPR